MSLKLPPALAKILRDLIMARHPELLPRVEASHPLSNDERQALRLAVTDELMATGLDPDDEPNERGLQLEEIIDRLGHL